MGVLVHVENGGKPLLKNRNFMQPMKRLTRGLKKNSFGLRGGGRVGVDFLFVCSQCVPKVIASSSQSVP
jgi:hypothetical protein